MLLSELQKQKKTKNIKCRIKKKKKKAKRLSVKFMKKYITSKFGNCTNFRYCPPHIDSFEFDMNGNSYYISIYSCLKIEPGEGRKIYSQVNLFINDKERIRFMEFAKYIYDLYTKTDYLDLKSRATTLLLCNLRNQMFPKGVDIIIAKKILFFYLF